MSEATDLLRRHVASYGYTSPHRDNCIDVCDEVDRLTAAAEQFEERCLWAEDDNEKLHVAFKSMPEPKRVWPPNANIESDLKLWADIRDWYYSTRSLVSKSASDNVGMPICTRKGCGFYGNRAICQNCKPAQEPGSQCKCGLELNGDGQCVVCDF